MRKVWLLIALGVGAYLSFALVTVPANVVLARLAPPGVMAAGVTGTIWNGRAQVLQAAGIQLGSLQWRVHVRALLTGRLRAEIKLQRPDGFAQTTLTIAPSGRLDLDQLSAALPVGALPPNIAPGGWSGALNAKLARVTIEKRWPTYVEGSVEARDLVGPARNPANIGSYKVSFPSGQQTVGPALKGALSDSGGPLQVTGIVQINPDRSYLVEGLIAPRPDAARKVTQALEYLGPADAQGRRNFSFAGTM